MNPTIWLEGPIASGKTTFCKRVAKELDFDVIREPIAANPYLELFYKNPKQWAFPMQIYLLHYRFAMKQEATCGATTSQRKGVILDGSIVGNRVFAKLHLDAGNIHPLNWDTYEFCYNVMSRGIQPPTLLVYLACQPETCFKRMKQRDRPAEKEVTFQYLDSLIIGYERMLRDIETGRTPWGHAVRVEKIIYDKDVQTDEEWSNIARTVLRTCERMA